MAETALQSLQDIADKWAEWMRELEGMEANAHHVQAQVDQRKGNLLDLQRRLLERVGRNIPRKIFGTPWGLVIVEHERGVSLQDIEKERAE